MKFSVSSSDLFKQLQVANGVISSNPVLPILEDFLFTVSGNLLTITATDLETSITTSLDVQTSAEGKVAVPAKILMDTLKALPEQPITIAVNLSSFAVEITSAYGKYRLAGEDGEDYPTIPQPEAVNQLNIPANALLSGIMHTLFATSTDELRLAMTGVFFQVENNALTCVATDAHKLVRFTYTNSSIQSDAETSFIIPKKALNLLKGSLSSAEEVALSYNRTNAFFSFGKINLVCRLIDARYPDYNAVIPSDNPNVLTISRTGFQSSLKRISIYANKSSNQVILSIAEGSLTVSAQDLDFSNEATEQLACEYVGSPMNIGFNAKFLVEMLNVLGTEEVRLELSTPTRAGVLLPSHHTDGEDILMLLMPVMLNN